VIEEIAMAEDTPEDLVHELIMLAHYGDQSISRPILGTEESVSGCSRACLHGYWQRMYRPQNAVLSVAGNYEWDAVLDMANRLLGDWRAEGLDKLPCVTRDAAPTVVTKEKDIEQVHICLGFPALPMGDDRNYDISIFNSVFGGAMSSRLFQKIREDSGLAYTVYSYPNAYTDTGMLSVYAATNPETAKQVYDMIVEEARALAEGGMTEKEFAMAREQLKSGYILGLESTSARMQSNGRRLLLMDATRTETETIDRINAVSLDAANALMKQLLTAPHSVALVGKGVEALAGKLD
jgi:predicted Zn-dependent peptidase